MTKSNAPTRKSKTHFEQVPVDVAKKFAEQDVPRNKESGAARPGVESPPRKKG